MKCRYAKRFLLAGVLAVPPASAAAAQLLLGVHADPDRNGGRFSDFKAFNDNIVKQGGPPLSIDNSYYGFNWSANRLARDVMDIQNGFIPMMSVSPKDPRKATGCVTLRDVALGHYNNILQTEAFNLGSKTAVASGPTGTVMIRLFYEPTDSGEETHCANPAQNWQVYVAAFDNVVSQFRSVYQQNGWTNNIMWVYAPGEPAYQDGHQEGDWLTFYPGADYVDVVAEDLYDKHGSDTFPGEICTLGPSLGKPLMISETGAVGANDQVTWLDSVKNTSIGCSDLSYFLYWDAPSHNDYKMGGPEAFQALGDIGNWLNGTGLRAATGAGR